jgi:general L-amino acid transport system substrate-binding protein
MGIVASTVSPASAVAGARLDRIRARGYLTCGVATTVAGFASVGDEGAIVGFEPDLCRAVAAAILGRDGAVRYVPARSVHTFVSAGAPDLVARRLTVTLRRERERGLAFGPVVFYDGAALLVRADAGIGSVTALVSHPICLVAHSETEAALVREFALRHIVLDSLPTTSLTEAATRFLRGECAALAADLSELAATRAGFSQPHEFAFLPGLLSKEPLALLLHRDDPEFVAIVSWTIQALIAAEELGVTRASVRESKDSSDPEVRQLLGIDPGNGAALGLDEQWAAHALETVGNYGEIYARHLGTGTPLGLERGLNALWRDGGLLYALPLR